MARLAIWLEFSLLENEFCDSIRQKKSKHPSAPIRPTRNQAERRPNPRFKPLAESLTICLDSLPSHRRKACEKEGSVEDTFDI